MELGLWVLFEWFEENHLSVFPRISDRNSSIRGIRMLEHDEDPDFEAGFAYISGSPGRYNWDADYAAALVYGAAEGAPDSIGFKNCSPGRALNAAMECFEFYSDWGKTLLSFLGKKRPLKDMLDASSEALPYPMAILDERTKTLAMGKLTATESNDYKCLVENGEFGIQGLQKFSKLVDAPFILSSRTAQFVKNITAEDKTERIRINIWINQKIVGYILAFDPGGGFRKGDLSRVNNLCWYIQKCMEIPSNEYLTKPSLESFFIKMISGEDYDMIELIKALGNFGWNQDDKYSIVRIESKVANKNNLVFAKLCERIRYKFQGCYPFIYDNGITLLMNLNNLPDDQDYILELTELMGQDAIITGVSYPFVNVMFVARYYHQACTAVYYGRYLQRSSPVYAASIALEEISQLSKNNEEISVFIHSDVQKLIAYDKKNNSDMSRSLFYYLYFGCNSTDAANYLGIHRNTLKYRLAKIQELLSLDIDDKKERLLLLISYIMFGFSVQR
jgi:hypothetical protein